MMDSGPSALLAQAQLTMDELTLRLAKLKLQLKVKDLSLRLQERETELIEKLDRLIEEKSRLERNGQSGVTLLSEQPKVIFMFADMQGYTTLSKEISPAQMVKLLNNIYASFFKIVEKVGNPMGIAVVKLAGDCIMLSGKSTEFVSQQEQARTMIKISRLFSKHIRTMNEDKDLTHGFQIHFRYGIDVGPAAEVAITYRSHDGMVVSHDWIGESVNKAARMESSGIPDLIQITPEIHQLINDDYDCSACEHEVKSYGKQPSYFVLRPLHRGSSTINPSRHQSANATSFTKAGPSQSTPQLPPMPPRGRKPSRSSSSDMFMQRNKVKF